MRVFTTHLWKEWREHRAVLLGILVAMPLLTAATFVGFASFGAQLANGAAVFTGGAAAMTALALSVELFAGEVTRRTLGFWRRQPGGLAVGWAAKVSMLVLAVSLATLWGGACFWVGCRVSLGAKLSVGAWASLSASDAYIVPLLSLAVGAWVLLVSTWIARGAAAVGLTILLLGAVAFPGFVLWGERTAFLRTLIPGVALAALAGIAFPLALSALSFFIGRRRSDRPFRSALACVAVIVLGGGAAYAHANARLERWLDVRFDDEDARVTNIFVGRGGHFAFASVTRAGDDTVRRPFVIDLTTGVSRPIGPSGSIAAPRSDQFVLPLDRRGAGLIERYSGFEIDTTKATMELLDGVTASSYGVFRMAPLEGKARELVRDETRATTPVRTLDGRKAWRLHQAVPESRVRSADGSTSFRVETWIEREAVGGDIERLVLPTTLQITWAMRAGWRGNIAGKADVFVPADFRTLDDCVPFRLNYKGTGNDRIDARRYLYRRFPTQAGGAPSWRVVDVVTESDEPAPGFDASDALLRIDGDSALVWRRPVIDYPGAPARRVGGLARIDLTTGTRGPDAVLVGGSPALLAWTDVGLAGASPEGKLFLNAIVAGERGFVVYDPVRHEMSRWTPTPNANVSNVAAIVDEDSIYLNEYEPRGSTSWSQRLMRVELGSGARATLLPIRRTTPSR